MISILINDIIPILVIMLLGYLCGKFYFFDNDQRQGLNKLVLDIALPAALFISIVKATRKMFAQDIVLTLISIVGVVGLFMLSYYLDKLFFHRTTQQAAVCALIAGSPTICFLGFVLKADRSEGRGFFRLFYMFGHGLRLKGVPVLEFPNHSHALLSSAANGLQLLLRVLCVYYNRAAEL